MPDYFSIETDDIKELFNLEEFLEFQSKHRLEVALGEDLQYMCYIDGKGWATGLTPLGAIVYGIKVFKMVDKA